MSTVRTWTLSSLDGEWQEGRITQGELLRNESVVVLEAEPVLDLLERFVQSDGFAGVALEAEIEDFLREHGRLDDTQGDES
jgi:hypothetical protein